MDVRNDKIYLKIFLQETANIYARLINQYIFKNHTLVSASFHKLKEEAQRSDEVKIYNTLKSDRKLTVSDIDNSDVKSQLEQQIQIQETTDS